MGSGSSTPASKSKAVAPLNGPNKGQSLALQLAPQQSNLPPAESAEELRKRIETLSKQIEQMLAERQSYSEPLPSARSNWVNDDEPEDPYNGPLPDVAIIPQLEGKEDDFSKLKLPTEESMLGSWPTVVIQSIPMTGRVYLSQYYISYRVVVFGVILSRIIHISDVTKLVYKEANRLLVVQWKGKYFIHFYLVPKDGQDLHVLLEERRQACKGATPPPGMSDGHTSASLTVRDMVVMLRGAKVHTLSKDTVVLQEGRNYENLYQVLQGRLEVQIGDPTDLVVLRVMQEGDMFGEMSFLEGGLASASVVAADERAIVCSLEGPFLNKLIQTRQGFGARLHKFLSLVLAERVRNLSRVIPSLNVGKEAGRRSLRRRMSVHENSTQDVFATPTHYFVYSEVGKSPSDPFKQNQDNYCVYETSLQGQKISFYGVFDGHGSHGHDVSKMIRDRLAQDIFKDLDVFARDPKAAIHRGFLVTNNAVMQADFDVELSGSTAVVVIQIGFKLLIANVGDSRAILGRQAQSGATIDRKKAYEAVELTKDQKPDDKNEMNRIVSAGGQVDCFYDENGNPDGPYRVFVAGEGYPGLAMARSIGDGIGKTCGVIADPVISEFTVDPSRDKFLILASDGVWEFLPSQNVASVVGSMTTPESSCRQLVFQAKQEWDRRSVEEGGYRDDITSLVIYLQPNIR